MSSAPWLVAALLGVSALGVARTQPRLAAVTHEVIERDDVYALPPPSQLHLFALGYDAAMVDLLWSSLLVAYGTHWHEKREFHPDPFLDAILELEPDYGPIYRFADTLLCYRPLHATEADVRRARAILERGTRERPGDYQVWIEYGQFTAFLGPGFLTTADAAEKDRWRRDGALALTRAVELGADTRSAVIAATILGRTGELHASIEALQRALMVEDDPDKKDEIQAKLDRQRAAEQDEEAREKHRLAERAAEELRARVESGWRSTWPFVSRGVYLLLAPSPDAARCAGPERRTDPACASDWEAALSPRGAP